MIDIERILTLYLEDRSCYCKLMRIIGAIGVYLFFYLRRYVVLL